MQSTTFSENLDTPVTLKQSASGAFFVVYGKQSSPAMDYERAALELGACIMHSLACNARIVNET